MTADLLHGDGRVVGTLTSGGTESVLMAVKAYRDLARAKWPHITQPEILAAVTVHPAFEKAAHYFGLTVVHAPVDGQFRADVEVMRRMVTRNTVLIVGSAPQYPHGVMDPIEALAELAQSKGIPCHVDACFGGFMLPWVEALGYPVPKWDFGVPGVTSISADIHKYGYAPKGASIILYRSEEYRKYQFFAYSQWPGGLFGSPSMAGSRPGGPIAAAWGVMNHLGRNGYTAMAKDLMHTTIQMMAGVNSITGLRVLGTPVMTAFAIASTDRKLNIYDVADAMEKLGWRMERNQRPESLHCTILPHHRAHIAQFVQDLRNAVNDVRLNPPKKGSGTAAVYGMVASIPDTTLIDEFIIKFFGEVFTARKPASLPAGAQ